MFLCPLQLQSQSNSVSSHQCKAGSAYWPKGEKQKDLALSR